MQSSNPHLGLGGICLVLNLLPMDPLCIFISNIWRLAVRWQKNLSAVNRKKVFE